MHDIIYRVIKTDKLYHMTLDREQVIFRDSILDENKTIIFCNAKSGTGKTTIATACAQLLYDAKLYNGIVYIASPTQEQKQGYLKGSIEDKSEPYFAPFYDAMEELDIPESALSSNILNYKHGTGYIDCRTHTYMRGINFTNKVVIIDEAQNYYFDELKKVLTRMHDSCKIIVIGHSGQIDLYHNPDNSGFVSYLEWYRGEEKAAICNMSINHRGWVSTHADNLTDPSMCCTEESS